MGVWTVQHTPNHVERWHHPLHRGVYSHVENVARVTKVAHVAYCFVRRAVCDLDRAVRGLDTVPY